MIRVVIVDDEEKVCRLICKLIHWDELEMELVGTAFNGIEALQLIETEHPNLVLTDIRMPGYDGMELLKRAREFDKDIEFIIISGYSHFEYAQTAIGYGVSDYILKPINEETLNATLQKVRKRYMEYLDLTEKRLELQKQQIVDQARVRDTLWFDLENAQIPQELDALNEMYRYHFKDGLFRTFLVQIDVKNNENISENYADNVMELANSKFPGIFEKYAAEYCMDSGIFCLNHKITGIINYDEENKKKVMSALENVINKLSMELLAFEYIRFHLAVSGEIYRVDQLSGCIEQAERVMGERLFTCNSLFLERLPENAEFEKDMLFKPFSLAIRQSLEFQNPRQLTDVVKLLHMDVIARKLNGVQILNLVREAYRMFLISGLFQSEYHFDNWEEQEENFFRKAELCCSHDNLFDLLAQICKRNMDDAITCFNMEKVRPISHAKNYIREHFAEPISLEEVSSVVGFSGSYFSTIFRKETGKNFLEYVMDVRIEEAKAFLRESSMTIENVARSVGINDCKRFSKTFRKLNGISPKEYRKLYS